MAHYTKDLALIYESMVDDFPVHTITNPYENETDEINISDWDEFDFIFSDLDQDSDFNYSIDYDGGTGEYIVPNLKLKATLDGDMINTINSNLPKTMVQNYVHTYEEGKVKLQVRFSLINYNIDGNKLFVNYRVSDVQSDPKPKHNDDY